MWLFLRHIERLVLPSVQQKKIDNMADLSKKIIDEKTEKSSDDGDPILDVAPAQTWAFSKLKFYKLEICDRYH